MAVGDDLIPGCKIRTEKEITIMCRNKILAKKKTGKNELTKVKRAAMSFVGAVYLAVNVMPMTVLASGGANAITQPLENLKTLVISVIGAVGVIILAKNVMEFAQAYQQQDSSTMNSALKGIVAGVMMAGISTVLSFLGF